MPLSKLFFKLQPRILLKNLAYLKLQDEQRYSSMQQKNSD